MKLGAERNKVILLIALSVIAAVTIFLQYFSDAPAVPATQPAAANAAAGQVVERPVSRPRAVRTAGQIYRPTFAGQADEPLDPMKVDPTLRTELLTKVRSVEFGGVERNLFQFTSRKRVEAPDPEQVAKAQALLAKAEPPPPPVNREPPKPTKPTAPPIKWKFYGFANKSDDARKRAFLLDTDGAVFVATEGDIFGQRYKIVRIGVNSIVIEDMQFKAQQTLPLEES
jgi:hypothetical protein